MMDFSDVRASFFAGLSTKNVRRTPGNNNGILGSPILSILIDFLMQERVFCDKRIDHIIQFFQFFFSLKYSKRTCESFDFHSSHFPSN